MGPRPSWPSRSARSGRGRAPSTEHTIGWLFLAIGACFAVESLVIEYVIAGALAIPGELPAVTAAAWLLTWLWIPPIGIALIFLPLLFPTGHLPSRRWRPVAWFGASGTIAFGITIAIAPGPIQQATFIDNPIDSLGHRGRIRDVIEGLGGPAVRPRDPPCGGLAGPPVPRSDDDVARRQIKWFALASTIAGRWTRSTSSASSLANATPLIKAFEIILIVAIIGLPVAAGPRHPALSPLSTSTGSSVGPSPMGWSPPCWSRRTPWS